MAGVAKFFNGHIHNKFNEEINLNAEKYRGKVIGLYFSAHWCPPCRAFTPVLSDFYRLNSKDKNFEVIFISADNDEESFNGYYEDMPWLKLDFKERTEREKLETKFGIHDYPSLCLLDGDSGNIICTNAREQVQHKDKKGEHFPWGNKETKSDSPCIIL